MALKKNMVMKDVEQFLLKGDLQDVLKYDVKPILHLKKEPGGFFGVPREILSLIDFLGAVYTGKYERGMSSKGAIKFIENLMGEKVDKNYKLNGRLMYEMYRHGLTHFFQPKKFIKTDGTKIGWCVHKGKRGSTVTLKDGKSVYKIKNAGHLVIVKHPDPQKDFEIFIISIRCLYEDFQKSLVEYFNVIRGNQALYLTRWNRVSSYMTDYESYPYVKGTWSQRIIKWIKKGVAVWH